MEEELTSPMPHIGRGTICDKKAGPLYKVKSYTMKGVTTRWIEAINAGVNEYKGDPAVEIKYQYSLNDEVYYFMFADGRGMILGPMRRDT